jgi:extracellular matrix regulatory protein A
MPQSVNLLNIGFGNVVRADRVVAIVNPQSAPMKRLREEARVAGKLVDATQGRRTRAIVITDSDHVILSAIQAETVAHRLQAGAALGAEERGEAQSEGSPAWGGGTPKGSGATKGAEGEARRGGRGGQP